MANLQSIDLTQHRRFERYAGDEKSIEQSVFNFQHDQVVRRLKKGELRHTSTQSQNSAINVTIDGSTLTTVSASISLSTSSIEYTVGEVSNMIWHTQFTSFDNSTIIDVEEPPIMIYDASRLDTIVQWASYDLSNSTSTYYYTGRKCDALNNTDSNLAGSIFSRIHKDPFELDYSELSNEFKRRLSTEVRDRVDKRRWKQLLKRNDESDDYDLYENAHDRLSDYDSRDRAAWDDKSYYDESTRTETKLKKLAPFIKRTYLTNRGQRFDSTEFRFMMVLAKERFEEAINKYLLTKGD